MIRKVAVILGLGGGLFDPPSGEAQFVHRCKAIGLDTGASPFQYGDSQGVYDFLKTADWRSIVGDSFGADYGPQYAGELAPVPIDFLGGFQPSMYATDVRNGVIMVPANVRTAHCIRDPVWLDTGGLGYATWTAADPKKTRLLVTEHRGAHPDDWGYSQDLMFAEIKNLVGA